MEKRIVKTLAIGICAAFIASAVGCGGGAKRRVSFHKRERPQSRSSLVVRGQSHKKPPRALKGVFIWPLDKFTFMSGFGIRRGRRHDGIDIAAKGGTPVKASADGKVVFSGRMRGYGNLILLKHDNNYFTAYSHNRENLVNKGKNVKQGQVIAKVGRTGRATGNHVHFEIRQGQQAMDPLHFLPARGGVLVKKGQHVTDANAAVAMKQSAETKKVRTARKRGKLAIREKTEPTVAKEIMGGGTAQDKRKLARAVKSSSRKTDLIEEENGDDAEESDEWDEIPPKKMVLTEIGKAMKVK